ncbi:HalD/BesD family halogenase [Enterovibrio coralii]|uniref:Fe2OG dioxygenase domain-containing protein n=1 Tax=Enterovibrio coralii TaxID=294935 RepID=A0A135I8W7_9GAMM|nr:hypothetical protein [Enterovibrio coralii]KXF81895.1 hypothetical protein ATN88_20650 [Enterovibrio coralii]
MTLQALHTQLPSAFSAAEIALDALIDLDTYPIHDIHHPKRKMLVADCHQSLSETGCAHVPKFMQPAAINAMLEEVGRLRTEIRRSEDTVNAYFSEDDPALSAAHPKRHFMSRKSSFINSDRLEARSLLRQFYDSDVVVHFLSECLGVAPIYRWADPLARNPYSVMQEGDHFPWHFDGNDFTVSILVQQSEGGGDFEYCPNLRNPHDENFEGVAEVLAGNRKPVHVLSLEPGDLQLFKGRYSLHSVTPIVGKTERVIALPTYVTDPYTVNRPHHAKTVYGEALPIHFERENVVRADNLMD